MTRISASHKVNRYWYWCIVFLSFAILACSSPFSFFKDFRLGKKSENESWQAAVDELRKLTRGQTIPQHLIDPEKPAGEEMFDPNQLVSALPHLTLRQGYTLDFVYYYDEMGGRPFLYAREEISKPFETYEAFQAASDACYATEEGLDCDYLDFIEGDGSEEGYFQWVLLKMMGNQFYLFWHAGYNDDEIIASTERMAGIVDKRSSTTFGEPLTASQKRQALRIDPAPVVKIKGTRVTVRVVWFTKWGGFYETTYTLTASAPYQIIDTKMKQLVPYDCQVMF